LYSLIDSQFKHSSALSQMSLSETIVHTIEKALKTNASKKKLLQLGSDNHKKQT